MRLLGRVVLKSRPLTGKGELVRRLGERFLLRFDDESQPARWVTAVEVMPERIDERDF